LTYYINSKILTLERELRNNLRTNTKMFFRSMTKKFQK
jgi:hypothetical protein